MRKGEQLARLTEGEATEIALAHPEGRGLARPLSARAEDRRRVPAGDARLARKGVVRRGGPGRAGGRRRRHRRRRARRGPARRSRGRWPAAREGSFGGKTLLTPWVWIAFCAVFLLGLADFRRPLSVRNLDLLALLAFSVVARLLQPRRDLRERPARLPRARLSARPRARRRLRATRRAACVRCGRPGRSRRRPSSSSASASGSTSRRRAA